MKFHRLLLFILIFEFLCFELYSQNYYWIGFSNKKGTAFSIANPENYLSQKAIQRRSKQNIPIDSLDLPVSSVYIQKITSLGATLVHSSKWLNGITVKSTVDSFLISAKKLPFVKEVQLTKPASATKSGFNKFADEGFNDSPVPIDTSKYGNSVFQVGQLNGQFLHTKNIRGQGMTIAVLDGGFYKANKFPAFDSLRFNGQILGIKDFVNPKSDIYAEHYHGMSVLSCMGGNIPGKLIGTAPNASYWLLRSEDVATEYMIEEDNWVAAAEFADSVGADVINSSLGYYVFDDNATDHTYADMDGKTTRVTRGANVAASRGILVFASAGNEGNKAWRFIIAPSDGDNVIAVGAVSKLGSPASFTSHGPAFDKDIKPNVSALGSNTWLQRADSTLGYSSGTSFSSPVMAGMGACLWQANPKATAIQVKQAIEQSAHLYAHPDTLLGYGIPNMKIADQILKTLNINPLTSDKSWIAFPNPVVNEFILKNTGSVSKDDIMLSFYSPEGRLIEKRKIPGQQQFIVSDLRNLPSGIIILKIETSEFPEIVKIMKSN